MKEKAVHREAFEYYFHHIQNSGKKDTVLKVCEKFNVAESTVWNWYKQLGWEVRVDERNHEVLEVLERKNVESIVDFKVKALGITDDLITGFMKNVKGIKFKSARDLDTIVKLHLLLLEQPTEIKQDVPLHGSKERLSRLKRIEELHRK